MGVSSGKETLRVLERDVDSKRRDLKRRLCQLNRDVNEDEKKVADSTDSEIRRELMINMARKRANIVNVIQRIGAMDALSIRTQDASDAADYVTLTDIMSSGMKDALDDMVVSLAEELRAGMESITGHQRMIQNIVDVPVTIPLPVAPSAVIVPPSDHDDLEMRFRALQS